ncbi:MAG: error-prone DNA polymerase [Thermomicrobiales bacterium]
MTYAELHLHTAYSFLDGASQPEEMVRRAQELGYRAIAITDHDGMYGAMEFARAAKDAGLQAIIGTEITLGDESHLTLLAESKTGYGNICRMLTDYHHGRPPNPVSLARTEIPQRFSPLENYAEGVILLTGCRNSQLARLIDAGLLGEAERVLQRYVDWFGRDNVVVELQQQFVFGDTPRIERLIALARRVGVAYAATGNVHYHVRERHCLQDVLVAIKHRTTLDGSHRERRANSEFYLHAPEEMAAIWSRYPEAIATTERIAERCAAFDLNANLGYSYPQHQTGTQETQEDYLRRICLEAFGKRYPPGHPLRETARTRMEDELALIFRTRLTGFFLLYREILDIAEEVSAELRGGVDSPSRRFLRPGRSRGSAVSSVVCYLIGLSAVDPIEHNLYVGRFLNDRTLAEGERQAIPDIDIDFPREIREHLIARIHQVYGPERAAMVCAFSTYRLRSAVRDVGKALGIPLHDLDRIAKLSEPRGAAGLADELARLPEYAARAAAPPWSFLTEIASQLAGFPRHITQHSGGMIISSTPLNELVPIQPAAMEDRYLCQWDKDSIDDAGFVKIDFLALGMLSLVEECLDLIDAGGKGPIDLGRINFADPAVYRMIHQGDTIGVFQIESRAQIQMIRKTKPEKLEDIVVQVAIVRPGPIVGGAVTPFVQRRLDPHFTPVYDHPLLEDVLKETLGVILYQEQVVQVAERLAGFTAGQADQLRRAMTRKRSTKAMEDMKNDFFAGAAARGVSLEVTTEVFRKLSGFAEYGFPKSHAAAFGLLAYQSCWLRHYYPAEFLCALLNNQPMGFYAPHVLINDARRHGLRVLQPDVNESLSECSLEGDRTVRMGLRFVKGLTEDVAIAIARDRILHGRYRSLVDLMRRVPLRKESVENLVLAGACRFGLGQREMLWQAGLFIQPKGFTAGRRKTKTSGTQLSLPIPTGQDMVDLPRMTTWEQMANQYRLIGHSHWHPMGLLRDRFPTTMATVAELEQMPDGMPVAIPGLIVCRQRPGTAKDITFLLLEDETGLVNVVVYPSLYEQQRYEVRSVPLLIVEGRLQRDQHNINIVATGLRAIEESRFATATTAAGKTTTTIAPPAHGFDAPPSDQALDPHRPQEADPRHIQLVRLREGDDGGPRSRADIRALSPDSHNYR